jgi:hypothetical protein
LTKADSGQKLDAAPLDFLSFRSLRGLLPRVLRPALLGQLVKIPYAGQRRDDPHDCEGVSAPYPKAVRESRSSTCNMIFARTNLAYAFT